jgi:hypothetical protein
MQRPTQPLINWLVGDVNSGWRNEPELAIQYAIMLPMNQAHTAVAGPPEDIGAPNVAGTDPNTPRIDMAYETVDHLEKCRRRTCPSCKWMLRCQS